MRTSPEVDKLEVWFRIVHLARIGQSCAPMAAYREQAVEIALRAKGPLKDGNIVP